MSRHSPPPIVQEAQCLQIVRRLQDAAVMRVVISGGEPLLHPHILVVINALRDAGVGVVLGTNGSFLNEGMIEPLRRCTRVEISLDAANRETHNAIRPSRHIAGDAWTEALRAIELCLCHKIQLRVLTAINAINQHHIEQMADVLSEVGVRDWALSWTLPAGRARLIYDRLRPQSAIIDAAVRRAREAHPEMVIRYSDRHGASRYYCLILPDGSIATEDVDEGRKVVFGSLLAEPLSAFWTPGNFDVSEHFHKWVGNRVQRAA